MAGIKLDTKNMEYSLDTFRKTIDGLVEAIDDLNANLISVYEVNTKLLEKLSKLVAE